MNWTKESVLEHKPPIPMRVYNSDGTSTTALGRLIPDGNNPFVATALEEDKYSWGLILSVLNDPTKTDRIPIAAGYHPPRPYTPLSWA